MPIQLISWCNGIYELIMMMTRNSKQSLPNMNTGLKHILHCIVNVAVPTLKISPNLRTNLQPIHNHLQNFATNTQFFFNSGNIRHNI